MKEYVSSANRIRKIGVCCDLGIKERELSCFTLLRSAPACYSTLSHPLSPHSSPLYFVCLLKNLKTSGIAPAMIVA
jgi:hypothetical protein